MTDDDREKILNACLETESDKIIITGAMRPERFVNSDASFNIGSAIGAINVLDIGIYISMNGRVFRWDSCQRDEKTGQFLKK